MTREKHTCSMLTGAAFSQKPQTPPLHSAYQRLDRFFEHKIRPGKLYEFGVPEGRRTLHLILSFFLQDRSLTLWISPNDAAQVYPPSWKTLGINLEQFYFCQTDSPIETLKPVFFESTFSHIVFFHPKQIKKSDMAFLAQQARQHQQLIVILRRYTLSAHRGNSYATVRANFLYLPQQRLYHIEALKGLTRQQLTFSLGDYDE